MSQVNTNRIEMVSWGKDSGENKLFTRITWLFVVITFVFAFIVKNVTVPTLTREEKAKIPPQLTKFIERVKIEERPKPKPIEEKKKEIIKEEVAKPVEKKPLVKPVVQTQEKRVEVAREKAKNSGLLAMQDDLAQLRDIAQMTMPDNTQPLSTQGSKVAVADVVSNNEKFVGTTAVLDNANINQTVDKPVDLTKHQLLELSPKEIIADADYDENQETKDNFIVSGRNVESIRKVLDRNKGAFYTIYRRALRKDPSLEGKVELLIVVAPNGSVSSCSILSSELDSPELERKLLARVKLINFGAQNVDETSINYSFNFLPF